MIDLRSDTVTRPTEAMLESMREATFGDDSRDGDVTVLRLEALAAERMGKEASAYMPSGTMTNLVALLAHVPRGGEVVLDSGAHILNSELGGVSALAGTFYRALPGRRGAIDVETLKDTLRGPGRNSLGTALVCMETSHNRAGGAVLPVEHMRAVYDVCREREVAVHTDGARVFNAAVALGLEAREIAQHTDSICFCVSKALSAPVGSLLCGSMAFIERARAFRRMVGGNMRQAGPLAAAAIVALESMTGRLAEDHRNAKRLADGLHRIDASLVNPKGVDTNIVKVALPGSATRASDWSVALKARGILVSPAELHALRFVTHRHVSERDIDETVSAFQAVWQHQAR